MHRYRTCSHLFAVVNVTVRTNQVSIQIYIYKYTQQFTLAVRSSVIVRVSSSSSASVDTILAFFSSIPNFKVSHYRFYERKIDEGRYARLFCHIRSLSLSRTNTRSLLIDCKQQETEIETFVSVAARARCQTENEPFSSERMYVCMTNIYLASEV